MLRQLNRYDSVAISNSIDVEYDLGHIFEPMVNNIACPASPRKSPINVLGIAEPRSKAVSRTCTKELLLVLYTCKGNAI